MRNTFPLIIAVALTAASPAAAQGTDNAVNADTSAALTSNDTAVNAVTDPALIAPANDMMAAPIDEPVDTTYSEPAPAKKSGFPWGVLGLVGLVGLMGRKRS